MVQQYDPGLPLLVQKETREDRAFDPLQSLLHLGDALNPGERVLCQVVARSGSERKMRRYRRIVQARNDPQQRQAQELSARVVSVILWAGVVGVFVFGLLFGLFRHNYLASAAAACRQLRMRSANSRFLRESYGYVPAWFACGETARYVAAVQEVLRSL